MYALKCVTSRQQSCNQIIIDPSASYCIKLHSHTHNNNKKRTTHSYAYGYYNMGYIYSIDFILYPCKPPKPKNRFSFSPLAQQCECCNYVAIGHWQAASSMQNATKSPPVYVLQTYIIWYSISEMNMSICMSLMSSFSRSTRVLWDAGHSYPFIR